MRFDFMAPVTRVITALQCIYSTIVFYVQKYLTLASVYPWNKSVKIKIQYLKYASTEGKKSEKSLGAATL